MKDYNSSVFGDAKAQQLAQALALITNLSLMQNFLADVMTTAEIKEISARFQAAKMLDAKQKYTDIQTETGLSSATVARISDWLKNGKSGYQAALNLIDAHSHIQPASAE